MSGVEEQDSAAMEEIERMETQAEEIVDHAEKEGKDMAEVAVGKVEAESGH
jgi:F0F1-type ATP synthase membrane subunit b/b'